jgi:hypothetical protein
MKCVSGILAFYLATLPIVDCGQSKPAGGAIRVSGKFAGSLAGPNGIVSYESVELRGPGKAATTQTDSEGRFSFAAVQPGEYTLTFNCYACYPFSQRIEINGEMDVDLGALSPHLRDLDVGLACGDWYMNCRRTKKGSISGRVIGKNSLPVSNALVIFGGWCGLGPSYVKTNEEGAFRFVSIPVDVRELPLLVKASGFEPICFGPIQLKKGVKEIGTGTIVMNPLVGR